MGSTATMENVDIESGGNESGQNAASTAVGFSHAGNTAVGSDGHQFLNHRDYRGEERWHASIDALARRWRKACNENAKAHDKAGYKANYKHIIFGLPAPVASLVTSAVAALWDSEDSVYFIVPVTCLAAVFSLVHMMLNMAGRAQKHWDYSARYGGIASKIDIQLVRDVDFRRPADEFLAETRQEIGALNGNAPQLPDPKGCCGNMCGCGKGEDGGVELEEEDGDGVTEADIRAFMRANRDRERA